MKYQRPINEGYYWYRDVLEIDGRGSPVEFNNWDIVKLQLYSGGHYKNNCLKLKKPILMMSVFDCWQKGLLEVKKSKGIWGKKIANLKD